MPEDRAQQAGEVVAVFAASITSYKLNARQDGYDVTLTIPMSEAQAVFQLNDGLRKSLVVTVARRRSRSRHGDPDVESPEPDPLEGA